MDNQPTIQKIKWLNLLRHVYDANTVQSILLAHIEYAKLDKEAIVLFEFVGQSLSDQQDRSEIARTDISINATHEQLPFANAERPDPVIALPMASMRDSKCALTIASATNEKISDNLNERIYPP